LLPAGNKLVAAVDVVAPFVRGKPSIAWPIVVPDALLTSRETAPEAAVELTAMLTGTAVPCVMFTALPLFKLSVVVVAVNDALLQLLTKFAASTDPRPVAKSYAVFVL
jgi:hypothetical protein